MQRPWHKHATWHLWFEACNVTFVVWVPHAIHCIQNVHRNAERSHPLSRLECKSRYARSHHLLFCRRKQGELIFVPTRCYGETFSYLHLFASSSDSRETDFTWIVLQWLQPMKCFGKGWIWRHRSILFILASGTLRISGDVLDGSNMSCNNKCQRVRTCWET